jgi:hypothetical protein
VFKFLPDDGRRVQAECRRNEKYVDENVGDLVANARSSRFARGQRDGLLIGLPEKYLL